MIKLTVISNTMPYQTGIVETSKWSRTSGGIRPTFSKMVKFGSFYGRLDASEAYARAWEAMTGSARLECLEGLVPKQWEVEPTEEAGRFFSRFFKQAPSEIGGGDDESLKPSKPVANPAEWTCKCGAKNSGKFCPRCGAAAPKPEPPKPRWKCDCGSTNDAESAFCENCGKKRPEPPAEPEKKLSEMTATELFALFGKMAAEEEAAAKAAAAKAPTEPIDVPQEDQKPVGDGQNRGSDGKFTKKDKK